MSEKGGGDAWRTERGETDTGERMEWRERREESEVRRDGRARGLRDHRCTPARVQHPEMLEELTRTARGQSPSVEWVEQSESRSWLGREDRGGR